MTVLMLAGTIMNPEKGVERTLGYFLLQRYCFQNPEKGVESFLQFVVSVKLGYRIPKRELKGSQTFIHKMSLFESRKGS